MSAAASKDDDAYRRQTLESTRWRQDEPLNFVAPPASLFVPCAQDAATASSLSHLDGSSSLSALTWSSTRKPLLGITAPVSDKLNCLLALSDAHIQQKPKTQSSLMGFFTAKPAPAASAAPSTAGVDEAEPVPGDAAGEGAGGRVDEDEPTEPTTWAASGGVLLEILHEMVSHVLHRDGLVLTAGERQWLQLLTPPSPSPPTPSLASSPPPLSQPARALYARLFARQGLAFALASLDAYAEVGNRDEALAAARELRDAGLVRVVSTDAHVDGHVDAASISAAVELLTGPRLKAACLAAGLTTRAPSTNGLDGGQGHATDQRRLLRERLNLPPSRQRYPPLVSLDATATDASGVAARATATTMGSATGGSGARLRPAQRSELVRRVLAMLGGHVVCLMEAPLSALLRAERLFFAGSFCSTLSTAAAAAMGVSNMAPPSYELPKPTGAPRPLLPSRAVLMRFEASLSLAAAYEASMARVDFAEADSLAAVAHTLLGAVLTRRGSAPPPLAASSHDGVESATAREARAFRALAAAVDDGRGIASGDEGALSDAALVLSSAGLHPAESEEWENDQRACAVGARMCFGWVCAAVLCVHVAWLEKRRQWAAAAYLLQMLLSSPFLPRRRGQWWVRLCVDRDHIGGASKADAPLLLSALADSHLSPADVVDLTRRAHRLGETALASDRRWRPSLLPPLPPEPRTVVVGARRLRHGGGARVLYVPIDDGGGDGCEATCTVEQLVLQEYREVGGWSGMHTETGIHCTLFALLMWDLLFDDAPPDAFTSRFQDAPHDLSLDGGEFVTARAPRLAARLDSLRAADGAQIAEEVRAAHVAHHGVRCRGISWARWGDRAEELAEIAGCLGGEALAAICECFAQDYGGWHGGMPDLVVWQRRDVSFSAGAAADIDARSSYGEARLVEVKSPSDKLSDQQRAWLHRLASRGVLVEVCRVAEGEPTQTERLRPSFAPPIPLSQPPAPVPDAPPPMLPPPVYHANKDQPRGSRLRLKRKSAPEDRAEHEAK